MNANEYGLQNVFNVNFDISTFTTLSLAFTRPNGSIFTVTNPAVTVGTSPVVTPGGTFPANQYTLYLYAPTDITLAGTYFVRLTASKTGLQLISDVVSFTVNP